VPVASLGQIGELLRAACPDELVEVAQEQLLRVMPGSTLQVLLADYRVSGLSPVLEGTDGAGGSLTDPTSATRCFGSQQPVVERLADGAWQACLPLSVWGQRLGVLVIAQPAQPPGARLAELAAFADELALALQAAENHTDRYRMARRRRRMTMAAEMQWDMLPGRSLQRPEFLLAGQLEPAYTVCGDHFDWSITDGTLTVTALNGEGQGIAATLLTAVAVNGMRNARRSGGSLVEQAELACDAVFQQYAGKRHVATVLMGLDVSTGNLSVIDAGSPLVMRHHDGQWRPLPLERQLPLGMFAETRYRPQQLTLQPGDRLLIVSDGVHAAAPRGQAPYGDRALAHALRRIQLVPATEAVATVIRALDEYHSGEGLADDAVVVCVDWNGPAQ
jgi:serine phosphatase RsbU (regulator of sigma subunit)